MNIQDSRTSHLLHSFRFRLTLWFVGILAVILGGFSLFIYFRQVQVLRSETTSRLVAQVSQLEIFYRSELSRLPGEQEEESENLPNFTGNLPILQEHDHFALIASDGRILQKSEHFSSNDLTVIYALWTKAQKPSETIPYELPSSTENESEHETKSRDTSYLFIGSRIEFDQERYGALILGSPIDPGNQLPRLALVLVLVFGLTLLIAFGGGFFLANQAMRPVQTITRTARDLSEYDLNRRLNLNRTDEIGELAATFDQMLARLQAAFERQRQFTADASHELRTPLAIIELEANRALERPRTPKEYEKSLTTIQAENEWMSRLVNELLTLARMDSGRVTLHLEKVDISDIAVDVVERLIALAQKSHVMLETGLLNESNIQADRTYLTHVLTNLIENAIKYANGVAPRVVVETGTEPREGQNWAWARITDNGPGISAEHLPHLFDRFYRIDEARTRGDDNPENTSGSGLGLAIVQAITQALGGMVDVQSEVGKGTIFTVRFPASER